MQQAQLTARCHARGGEGGGSLREGLDWRLTLVLDVKWGQVNGR